MRSRGSQAFQTGQAEGHVAGRRVSAGTAVVFLLAF